MILYCKAPHRKPRHPDERCGRVVCGGAGTARLVRRAEHAEDCDAGQWVALCRCGAMWTVALVEAKDLAA